MELLERKTYLAEMRGLLQQAVQGQGGTLFLSGEAGIGKSALTRAFCERAPDSVRILTGACDPLSTPRPLGPLLDVSGEMSAGIRPLIDAASSRTELFEAVLADLRTPPPTLMIVEDALGRRLDARSRALSSTPA